MKFHQLVLTVSSMGLLLSCATSCSNSEEPPVEPIENETELAETTFLGKLVTGEVSGSFVYNDAKEYERELGQSEWVEFNPFADPAAGNILVGYTVGIDFPNQIVFRDSECIVEFIPNVLDPELQYSLLDLYWEAYCQKVQQDSRIYVRVPYEYSIQEKSLKLGRKNYIIESTGADHLQLGYYSSDANKEFKRIGTFSADASVAVLADHALVYDSYEQMHDDILGRLKGTFGEEGDISSVLPAHPSIKFEELEREMAQMAYQCPYWFAPKP